MKKHRSCRCKACIPTRDAEMSVDAILDQHEKRGRETAILQGIEPGDVLERSLAEGRVAKQGTVMLARALSNFLPRWQAVRTIVGRISACDDNGI